MKRLLILLWLLIFLYVNLLADQSPFKVIQMDEHQIILEFNLPEYQMIDADQNRSGIKRLLINDALYLSEEGKPVIPFFSEQIGLPADGDFYFEILSKKEIQLPYDKILITPNLIYTQETKDVNYTQASDLSFYATNSWYPASEYRKNQDYFLGLRKVRAFQFFPAKINPAQKKITLISNAKIKISISGNKKKSADAQLKADQFKTVNELVLNPEQSKNWLKDKEKTSSTYKAQRKSSSIDEIYLIVKEEGLYKVTYQELADSLNHLADSLNITFSLDLQSLDPRYLELYDRNGPVPIHFAGENDGSFDASDYFEFYGMHNKGEQSYYNNYTKENVYRLKLIDRMGTRMAVENGGLQVNNPTQMIVPTAYEQTVHFEKQQFSDRLGYQIYQKFAQGLPMRYDREDVLFWKSINAPDLNITPFELEYPVNMNTRYFSAKISLFGSSYKEYPFNQPDHHAIIRVNSALINNKWWSKQTECIFENMTQTQNSHLNHGTNYLYIDLPGDTPSAYFEQIFLDYFQLTYWREYKSSKNELKFSKPSNKGFGLYQFEISNFTDENVSLYKIGSSVFSNLTIVPFSPDGLPPYTIKFQDQVNSDGIDYYLCTENNKKKIFAIRPNYSSDLRNPDQSADYVIITDRAYMEDEATLQLKQLWESRSYQVKIVDIQDIYDEFSASQKSPDAIKAFLSYAYNNWQEPQLSNVLLLGDGIFDKRNEKDIITYDVIPVKNIWTYKHGATSCDNWYACIVGDDPVADINIARISIHDKTQISAITQKSMKYVNLSSFEQKWLSKITLTSGGKLEDVTDYFAQQSESIRKQSIPEHYFVQRVYTAALGDRVNYIGGTFQLKDRINEGTVFLQFMGHGGSQIWSDYNLLNASDIKTLSNSSYPIVSSLACFASAFDNKGLTSISEVFVAEPNKGAIAHIGFSGLGYLFADEPYGHYLAQGLFQKNLKTIGDAVTFTKASFYGRYGEDFAGIALTHGTILTGDPLIPLIRPSLEGTVQIEGNQFNAVPGDTLLIKGIFSPDVNSARMYVLDPLELPQNIPYDFPVINGQVTYQHIIPNNNPVPMLGQIKFIASATNREIINASVFTVGNEMAYQVKTIPQIPTPSDSIQVTLKLLQDTELSGVYLIIKPDYFNKNSKSIPPIEEYIPSDPGIPSSYLHLKMLYNAQSEQWELKNKLFNFKNTGQVQFYFKMIKSDGNIILTNNRMDSFTITGPDVSITFLEFGQRNNLPVIKVLSQNIGNTESFETMIRLYSVLPDQSRILITEKPYLSLQSMEKRWDYIDLPVISGQIVFEVTINEQNVDFIELEQSNNSRRLSEYLNLILAGLQEEHFEMSDHAFKVDFPANLLSMNAYFNITPSIQFSPQFQEDTLPVQLISNQMTAYKIACFNQEAFADSNYIFPNNKKITLSYIYNPLDSLNQVYEDFSVFAVYRWEDKYKKWIHQPSFINQELNIVQAEVNRMGIYGLFRNMDKIQPSIDVNVEGQEFSTGSYISGNGVLSFLFSDANGIDILDNKISMFLNGVPVDDKAFAISAVPGYLNQVPMKYKLSLLKGNYTISVSCTDVNGINRIKTFDFKVNDRFDLIKVANYPNPVQSKTIDPINANRTRFTYSLTDDADMVKIKIYTVSGRLVKTFDHLPSSVGYHEYPRTVYGWDCSDDSGVLLANGVYFYKVIAKKGNKEIIKTGKMAVLR